MGIETLVENSVAITQFFQDTFPNLLVLMRGINVVSEPEVCFLLFIGIYWGINREKGSRYIYLLGLVLVIFSIVQHALQVPAPFWFDKTLMKAESGSFAAPNLNIAIAILMALPFRRFIRTDLVLPTFLAAGILVGLSQVYLGIAGMFDLFLGFILAIFIVLIWRRWNRRFGKSFAQRILGQRFWIAIFFTACLGLIYYVLINWVQGNGFTGVFDNQIDQNLHSRAWQTGFINTIQALAILGGAGVGISIESARIKFRPIKNPGSTAISWIIGFLLLGGILYLTSVISTTSAYFQTGEPLSIIVLALKSILVTVFCAYIIPWLLTIVGTATSEVASVPTISLKNYSVER